MYNTTEKIQTFTFKILLRGTKQHQHRSVHTTVYQHTRHKMKQSVKGNSEKADLPIK
jgi:hypothetical protein